MKLIYFFKKNVYIKAVQHAYNGLLQFVNEERNAKLHLLSTVLAVTIAFYFGIKTWEWIALIFSIVLVFISEMLNTAIEKLADIIEPNHNPKVKFVKDVAAAAVLIAAVLSVIVVLIIFIPKL